MPGMQIASFTHRIILSSVVSLALPYFSTLSHKRHDLRENEIVNIKCVLGFSLQILPEIFPILGIIKRDIIINLHRYSHKVTIMPVRF